MKKSTRFLAVLLAGVMVLSMAACGGSNDSGTKAATETKAAGETKAEENKGSENTGAEKIVTIAITNSWATWCPYFDAGNYTDIISDQLYDRLWVTLKDGTVEPRLAKSYEIAPDHASMTIHLDEAAKFSDGEPVTADDVIFSAKLDCNPEFNSVKRDQMKFVKGTTEGGVCENEADFGWEKIDDYTVKLSFKEPMNELNFLTMMNRYFYIIPEHIYSQYSVAELNEAGPWKDNMIGSGPFIYDTSIDGERIEMVKNENYFLGTPDIDRLVIRVVEGSQLLSSLIGGEVDVIAGAGVASMPLSDWPAAQEEENLETVSATTWAYQAMIINCTSDKIPNAECRNAINMAVNRQAIVDNLLEGQGVVLYAPFSNEHPFVDESKLTLPKYDPEAAKAKLEDNGFDFSQTLELIVPVGNEVRIQSTVLIQQDLEAIGVKTNITQYDFPTLMQMMRDGDYDLGMCGSAGSIDPTEPLGWLGLGTTQNFPCIMDYSYTELFGSTNSVLDTKERAEAFVKVWQHLLDDSPVCYLYSANFLAAYNKDKVSGVDYDLSGQLNWKTWTWKVNQ